MLLVKLVPQDSLEQNLELVNGSMYQGPEDLIGTVQDAASAFSNTCYVLATGLLAGPSKAATLAEISLLKMLQSQILITALKAVEGLLIKYDNKLTGGSETLKK